MLRRRFLLPDFRLGNGDGRERPYHEYLAAYNILLIRRVPVPSHGPPTELLRRLLARKRGPKDVTVRWFDIRTPDRLCETCGGPHIVFQGADLLTICDSDGGFYRLFGVVGDDRFFVIRSDRRVIDVGSTREISTLNTRLGPEATASQQLKTRPSAALRNAGGHRTVFDGRIRPPHASK